MEQEAEAVRAAVAPVLLPACSEAVRAELLDECEEHFDVLQKVTYFILFFFFKEFIWLSCGLT